MNSQDIYIEIKSVDIINIQAMNPNNHPSNPVKKLSAKLQDEIEQVEVQEKELKAKEDTIQAEHSKIHHAEQELQSEHTKLEQQRNELEYRLQEVKNEV